MRIKRRATESNGVVRGSHFGTIMLSRFDPISCGHFSKLTNKVVEDWSCASHETPQHLCDIIIYLFCLFLFSFFDVFFFFFVILLRAHDSLAHFAFSTISWLKSSYLNVIASLFVRSRGLGKTLRLHNILIRVQLLYVSVLFESVQWKQRLVDTCVNTSSTVSRFELFATQKKDSASLRDRCWSEEATDPLHFIFSFVIILLGLFCIWCFWARLNWFIVTRVYECISKQKYLWSFRTYDFVYGFFST